MNRLFVSFGVVVLLAGLFIYGVLSTTTALMIFAFCSWTPAVLVLGYFAGRAGLRIAIQSEAVPVRSTRTPARKIRKLEDSA